MKKKPLDPYAYIENAFLDRPKDESEDLPKISSYLSGKKKKTGKYQKTEMRAPRPRVAEHDSNLNPKLTSVLEQLPKTVTFLSSVFDDEVTAPLLSRRLQRDSRRDDRASPRSAT